MTTYFNPLPSSFLCYETTTLLVHSVSICMPSSHDLTPVSSPSRSSSFSTPHSTHCTHSSHPHPMMPCCVCLHSVISLLTVGMLSVFVSPFSFFMHSTTLRRSSASPANSSMFLPAHSFALLSFCILHHYSSFSHLPSHSLAILDRLL